MQIDQPGTYWYHSHNRGQYPDGLRGPLVVHDPNSPYKGQYDAEIVLTLSDWYHQQMPALLQYYLSNAQNPSGNEPVPVSTLMNDAQNIKLDIQAGQVYLVRMISIAAIASHIVHFDQHSMKIVEVDGVYTDPKIADTVSIAAGQRYSVLIQAKDNDLQNFAFTSTMDPAMFEPPPANPSVQGTLVYNKRKPMPVPANATISNVANDFDLVPKDHQALLGPVDHQVTINANFATLNGSNRSVLSTISCRSSTTS